jgi:hypothetical protein
MVADPSISWFGTAAVSELVKGGFFQNRSWGLYGEDIAFALRNALGDDIYESSILYGGYPVEGEGIVSTTLNTMMPGYMRSVINGIYALREGGKSTNNASDRFVDEVYTHWRTGFSEWIRNGRIGEPPTMETASKSAANMSFIRAVIQFAAPISASFDPVTRAATSYYADLVEMSNGDYDIAEKVMIDEWGVDALSFIGSNQKNIAGTAATLNDIKMLRKNTNLLEKIGRINSKYAGMLSTGYGDIAGTGSGPNDYSTEIAAIYKRMNFPGGSNNPITQKKTSDELQKTTEARVGWAEYQKAVDWRNAKMKEYGINSTYESRYETSGIKRIYDEMVQDVANDFPGWVDERDENRKDYWNGTIKTVEAIVENVDWRTYAYSTGNNKWEEIAFWVGKARNFKTEYNRPNNSDERKLQLKQQFSQFHYEFLQTASEEFDAFATRWLNNMPELDKEYVVTE